MSHAQFGSLLGSFDGTYCKVKKNNVISARTQLPMRMADEFTLEMTLRRLASLTRDKGFPAFVVTDQKCGTLLINTTPSAKVCTIVARMEQPTEQAPVVAGADTWFEVEAVLRKTQPYAASYPVTTGVMNKGNKCVID